MWRELSRNRAHMLARTNLFIDNMPDIYILFQGTNVVTGRRWPTSSATYVMLRHAAQFI